MTAGEVWWPVIAAMLAFLVSFAVAGLWRAFALRRQWLDQPDDRRLHTLPTPRGGGVAIALVLLAASPALGQGAVLFAAGLAVTAGAGLADDLRPLPPAWKLLLQALGAVPLALAWPLLPSVLGDAPAVAAAWCLVMVMVNFWNFMDGSNGLAATQALLVGIALALVAGVAAAPGFLALVLAAACLGFLPYNLPRARLFLGDVGSHALGYTVAALGLMALAQGVATPWQLLLLPSAFLIDAGLTLLSRLARRQRVWRAHREHLYQRAISHGASHGAVCAAYAAWTGLAAVLAWQLAPVGQGLQLVVLLVVLTLGASIHAVAGRRWPVNCAPETEPAA
jgi:UDP-N-acetylmuramyl pentapeptide phosphotransferase/UDP-N-acetylglucosamine-1-phosphate transferase